MRIVNIKTGQIFEASVSGARWAGVGVPRTVDYFEFKFDKLGRGTGKNKSLAVVPDDGDPVAVAVAWRESDGFGLSFEELQRKVAERERQKKAAAK